MDRPPRERSRGLKAERPETDFLLRAGELAGAERPFAVVTVVRIEPSTSARVGNRAIVFPDGSIEGWVGGGCIQPTARREGLAALREGEPRLVRISPEAATAQPNVRMARMTCASEGTADLYVEPFLPRPTLVAAGSSPVTNTLAALASPLGFRFVGLETAAELNDETVPYPRDSWMVVATFGEFDEDAVEAGLRLGLPYVGLVASKRRAETLLSGLRDRGITTKALEAVRTPAGLPIGADSQEEIALSIMAEIVSIRAKLRPGLSEEPVVRSEKAVDPVCGMIVEAARHVSEHAGVVYRFCCPGCKRKFEEEPEMYVARISS